MIHGRGRTNGHRARRHDANVRAMRTLASLTDLATELWAEVSRRALDEGAAEGDDDTRLYTRWLVAVSRHLGAMRSQLAYVQEKMANGTYDAAEVRAQPRYLLGNPPVGVLRTAEGESSSIVTRVNALHWAIAQVTRQPIKRGVR